MGDSSADTSRSGSDRTILLINARARLGRSAEDAVAEALARRGLHLDRTVRVRRPSQLSKTVALLIDEGVDRLIVGGGDGTLGSVAAHLAERPISLGVIPLGTANDFARTLLIPRHLASAAAIAAGSHVREIDLARANGEFFLNVASIGLSVLTTSLLSLRLKRWLGPAAYSVAGAMAFTRHPTFWARINTPAGAAEGMVHQVVIGNGRFYGGGVLVANHSTLEDGMLDVYTLGMRGRWQLLRTMAMLRFKVPLKRPGDVFLKSPTAFVETRPSGKRVNLDGEIRTRTPVTFTIVRKALRVLTPSPDSPGGDAGTAR